MKRTVAVFFVCTLAAFAVAPAQAQLGPAPSWVLTQGAPGTCVDDDVFLPGVFVNVPAPMFASERGVLSAPGIPDLGFTQDTSFQGVGEFGFNVFTDPYALPDNTPLTLSVTTYHQPNFLGGVAYVSWITWDCTTGAVLASGGFDPSQGWVDVPTLSPAGLTAFVALLGALGALVLLRRRRAASS